MAKTVVPQGRISGLPAARRRGLQARNEEIAGFIFIAPWLIGFLVFHLGPLVVSLYLSFTRYDLLTPPKWIGLTNWTRLLRDPLTWQSLKVTAQYALGAVILGVIFGLALAILLNQNVRGLSVYRTVYYLPAVVSGVSVAMMWILVFHGRLGILNRLLALVGIPGPEWLADSDWVLVAFIVMSVWGVGGGMVLYLAALQGVPTALYDAAKIDGAKAWQQFRHVTVPMISPVILFNVIIGIIGSFQVFTTAFVMTGGGPGRATYFIGLGIYLNAFQFLKMGYASAMAWLLTVIILLLTFLGFKISGRWVYYEEPTR